MKRHWKWSKKGLLKERMETERGHDSVPSVNIGLIDWKF